MSLSDWFWISQLVKDDYGTDEYVSNQKRWCCLARCSLFAVRSSTALDGDKRWFRFIE